MSADNGIYILKTKDNYKVEWYYNAFNDEYGEIHSVKDGIIAYRVAHTQAIDNFRWCEENQLYMLGKYMYDVWGKSKVYYSQKEAFEEAQKRFNEIINSDFPICEYGIQMIDARKYSFN